MRNSPSITIAAAALLATAALAPGCARGPLPRGTVEIAGTSVAVEIAATRSARARGLAGRETLAPGTGMWFIYPTPGRRTFWMQGMRFPLDIVFVDDRMRVVEVVPEAPAPLPGAEPFEQRSSVPARHVLELPAGFCARHGVRVGTEVRFAAAGLRERR